MLEDHARILSLCIDREEAESVAAEALRRPKRGRDSLDLTGLCHEL